jgi:NitT/TauT family transport system substrate-binding protein
MLRRLTAVIAAATMALAMAGCGSDSKAGSDTKIVYLAGTAAPNLADSVWFAVGQRAGFFKAQGLTVTGLNNDGSSAAIKALAGGAGDVAVSELPNVIGAASTGVPIRVFSNFVHQSSNFLGVLPDSPVKTVADLKGKTIGVPSLGSGSQIAATQMLRDAGVDPKSVKFIAVGAGATVPDAMNKHNVDAVCSLALHFQTLEARTGLKVRFLDRPDSFKTLTGALFLRRAGDSRAKNEAIDKFAKAVWQSILFTLANPEKAVQMAYDVFPDLKAAASPGDVDVVNSFYKYVTPPDMDYKDVTDWATVTESTFDQSYQFAKDNGLIIGDKDVTYDGLVDSSSFATINSFDKEAATKAAEK